MIRVAALIALATPLSALSAEALLQVDGVFGECRAVLGAVEDSLTLHKEPDRSAATRVIPYKKGWEVLYTKRDGKTQILELGVVRVQKLGAKYSCRENERAVFDALEVGDRIEYLHYVGEGYARVRVDGKTCDTDLEDRAEYLEVMENPKIDVWIRVLYGDGSSPGWLLDDNTQTRVAGVEC
ncbi:MAG: hypothetical protein AAFY15_05070 [Cyanobacteria bacterium J06648_11]